MSDGAGHDAPKHNVRYKEPLGLSDQTGSDWLRAGRLLSQYACATDNHGTVTALAMNADWVLLGTSNHKIHVFNAHTGLFVRTLLGHTDAVWCLSLISGSSSNNAARGESQKQTVTATNPDGNEGRPYPAPSDGSLKLINYNAALGALDGESSTRRPPTASPIVVSAGSDHDIRVWDLLEGKCLHVLRGHTATIRCLTVVPGRPRPIAVSGARDHSVCVWDLERGEMIRRLEGHGDTVRCLDVAGNKIASGSFDATCRIWDADTGQCLHTLIRHRDKIYCVAFDGEKVATGSLDTTVRIWNARSGECLAVLEGHTSLVATLQLTDRVLVSGGSDGRVMIFSLETYECLHRLRADDNSVTCLQFDEHLLVTGGNDGRVKLWDFATGEFVRELGKPSEQVLKMAFREDKCVIVGLRDSKPSMEVISFRSVTSA